jgi:galactokinase
MTDTEIFLQSLRTSDFFNTTEEIFVARAPGRLDVMGGIADYSGSLVLQLPIADATHVALQKASDDSIRLLSTNPETRRFNMRLGEFVDYNTARELFAQNTDDHWASYVAGAFLVLMRESGVRFDRGVNILISSNVPEGKGVSSSAALEVATMQAIISAFDINLSGVEVALLCQKVENLIAGAPCGIMDQMTASCGEKDRLLELLCQPSDLKGTLPIPEELELWGIDSGIRHSVGGSDYGTVRTAAFMGYRMIAEMAQLKGYLANITPKEFEENYTTLLPQTMSGEEFLARYQGISDVVTSVKSDIQYPVFAATRHPIYEHARVTKFRDILNNWQDLQDGPTLGALMFESHQSYSDCGLGSERTDQIVTLVREQLSDGLYGARITGGGSGGTVAVLGQRGADISKLTEKFFVQTGHQPMVISGSSPGANAFGCLEFKL